MTRLPAIPGLRSAHSLRSIGLAALCAAGPLAARGPDYAIVFAQEAVAADAIPASRLAVRSASGRLAVLTEGFAAAADPAVSHDGQRLLFAGRLRPDDPWDIWEMATDGSGKRRVTSDLGDCREPAYLAPAAVDAPDFRDKVAWMTFTSTATQVLDERGLGPLRSLYAMTLDPVPGRGTVTWRTTYNLGGDVGPTVLRDGRILFSAWQRAGYALMTMSWAGENLNPLYGSHDSPWSQISACELPESRQVVFIESDGLEADGPESDGLGTRRSGRLASVSFRRPLHSYRTLSRPGETYRSPHWAPEGDLLVSAAAGGSYGIYLFDVEAGRRQGRVFDDPAWHDVDAQPLVSRPEPVGRIPMVGFASVLDRGEYRGNGQIQCLSVYETDRPEYAGIGKGSIARVRLVEGIPLPLPGRTGPWPGVPAAYTDEEAPWPPTFVRTHSLGEAPVEADGSFYANVAGDVPFYIESLDEGGNVVQTMRTWIWVRAGDQRGCVGCHENKELGPENRATEALVKARPADLTDSRGKRGRR